MITKKTDSATDWPAYIPRGKQGHTKKLEGEEKEAFLQKVVQW
jgi:hypothetical protein